MISSDEILVVGAGPTGLMLACWLARFGVRARVVDSKPGPANESRAVAVQARTMETYDMLGLGDRALSEGVPARSAAAGLEEGAFCFIRPDGYVAYAASRLDSNAFTRYLKTAWGATPDALNMNRRSTR